MTTEQKIAKVKCLKSLEFHVRYFFKHQYNRKFIVSNHHRIIFETLEKVARGELKRVIFNVAPRYGKTETIVKGFMSWGLALNPKSKYIHTSYSDGLALDNSETIKNLIQSQEYQDLFPAVKIKTDSRAKEKWYTTDGGGVLARSSSGQVTGFGAGNVDDEDEKEFLNDLEKCQNFGGAIIIDDPIKPDDASSDTIREKINLKFETTIRSRVNSRNTPIIIVMQRLHEEDLCGYLMGVEPDEWTVISLPVINEDGTPLWEHKHTIEELNKLRKANEFVFDTQYMQNPKPNVGLVFPKEELNFYNSNDIDLNKANFKSAFVDIADKGDDSHSVPIGYNIGQKIYIDDVLFTKLGTDKNVELTANILNKHKPEWTRVESNMGGNMYVQLLSNHYKGQLLSIRSKSNKHVRILTLSGFIKEFCYFRSDYTADSDYAKFMTELTRYRKMQGESKHDDAPDSLHGLVNMIRRFYPDLYKDYIILGKEED